MSDEPQADPGAPTVVRFMTHLFDLPHWQKLIVVIAGALGIAGVGGKLSESSTPADQKTIATQNAPAAKSGASRSILPQSSPPPAADQAPPAGNSALQSFLAEHGPWMRRVGLTFLAMFIVGWLFRAFVKMMTGIATLAMLAFLGLSYFGVTNVDLTAAHQKYDDTMAWVNDQATRAKDALIAHVPAGASSTLGFVFGFRRNRR